MTNYQTTIQNPGAIRWGSAKIEIKNDSNVWVNVGALKSISATTTTSGEQKFKPDNAPPITRDPTPETWDWSFELQEGWNPTVIQLLRGNIDTVTTASNMTTIGVYAGTGNRPQRSIRITNTTPGMANQVITLNKAKCTSELDFSYPADEDGTVPIVLPVKVSAEIDGINGFGTIVTPNAAATVTISPASATVTVGGTQQLTVTGGTTTVYGSLDVSVATVSSAGLITGVAAGNTLIAVTTDSVTRYVPVAVTSS